MSDVEKKSETQEAAPKKKPYNLREKEKGCLQISD